MRHVVAALACAGVIAGAAAGANALATRSASDGIVWLWVRAGAMPRVLASSDVRVLALRGPLVQLYVPSLAHARWPPGSVWAAIVLPAGFGLAACG